MTYSFSIATVSIGELQEIFSTYWQAGSWLMFPLAITAFFIWFRYFSLRQQLKFAIGNNYNELLDKVTNDIENGEDMANISQWLTSQPGASPHMIKELLLLVKSGTNFKIAFQQCFEREMSNYSHSFQILAALVASAPLLGLLGTVFGMISTFDAVALNSGETAQLVAGGISQALITTQVGLIAAIPGSFALAHLSRLSFQLKNQLNCTRGHLCLLLGERELHKS